MLVYEVFGFFPKASNHPLNLNIHLNNVQSNKVLIQMKVLTTNLSTTLIAMLLNPLHFLCVSTIQHANGLK